ncbi:MAG: DUF2235 domain-containing protein [Rhodothermaceae bacterium]
MAGKNIIVCCDGTGNEYRAKNNTNVIRLVRVLKKDDSDKQIVFYDPGVGTFAAPGTQLPIVKLFTKILGLAFGYGFTKNVTEAYKFLMNHYEDGDKIYLFGFSRGSYTARAIAGFIKMLGLLKPGSENLIPYAFNIYKGQRGILHQIKRSMAFFIPFYSGGKFEPEWRRAAGFKKVFSRKVDIHFIGVWDTVKSIGWIRRRIVLPHTFYNNIVKMGRHAVSIDEKRSQYRPNHWGYKNGEKFREVWFAGVHSDIGGSYPQRGLSDVTLHWMIKELQTLTDIEFDYKELLRLPKGNPLGEKHNPLIPIWWILGWWSRKIVKYNSKKVKNDPNPSPMIFDSVKVRMEEMPDYKPEIPPNVVFVGNTKKDRSEEEPLIEEDILV